MHAHETVFLDLEVAHTAVDLFQGDTRLETRQRGSETEVRSLSEGQRLAGVSPDRVGVGIAEDASKISWLLWESHCLT